MNGLTYLILAIISEVIATTVLKASDGLVDYIHLLSSWWGIVFLFGRYLKL